jgi:hypothetical protein
MTREAYSGTVSDWALSTWRIYPPGCLADYIDLDYNVVLSLEGTRYLPEHRTRPPNSELLNNLTGRERVMESRAGKGLEYKYVLSPCPHSGVHGQLETRYYYSASAPAGLMGSFPLDAMINEKRWSEALRRKLQRNRVNIASSVAEYKESCKLFYELALTLRNAYRTIRKGKFRRRRRLKLSDIPASVLQFNFGVAPLFGDLYSVVEALRLKLTAPILMRESVSIKIPFEQVISWADFTYDLKGGLRQRATIYYDIDPTQYLSEYVDFGNPVEWVWELIPFSFMVDWLIPIGDWLGNLDALTGITNIRGVVTSKMDQRWTASWNQADVSLTKPTGYWRSYQRDLFYTVPVSLPRWEPSGSWKKLLNASSILANLKLKGIRPM